MYKTLLLINIHVKIHNRSIVMPFSGVVTVHGPVDNGLEPQILFKNKLGSFDAKFHINQLLYTDLRTDFFDILTLQITSLDLSFGGDPVLHPKQRHVSPAGSGCYARQFMSCLIQN